MWDNKRLSILIAGIDCFIGDSARGILNPVLWPLAQRCGASMTTLGLLVSTFSIGRVVISTEIGRYADESIYRHRGALLISGTILMVGIMLWANVVYAGGLPTLFIAQFLLGLGTGNLGVLRSYVAEQAVTEERTWQLARLSSLQYAGFAATPIIGALLYYAGSMMDKGDFKYAFPAYFMALLVIITQVLLYVYFKNIEEFSGTIMTTTLDGKRSSSYSLPKLPLHIVNKIKLTIFNIRRHTSVPLIDEKQRKESHEGIVAEEDGKYFDGNRSHRTNSDSGIMMNPIHILTPTTTTSIPHMEAKEELDSTPYQLMVDHETISSNKAISNNNKNNNTSLSLFDRYKLWLNANFCYESNEESDLNSVYRLFILLNFTTRGVVAIYESIGTALLLDQYNLTELEVGCLVSVTGVIGTINLILFKDFWTKYFDDMTLMIGGLLIMLYAQVFVINFGKDQSHPLWEYALSLALVYSIGYPISNSAVLGMFSVLSKNGKQGKAQGQFALMGSMARIVMPIIASVANQYLDPLASFGIACILMSISIFGIVWLYHRILFFRYGNPFSANVKNVAVVMTDEEYRNQEFSNPQCFSLLLAFGFGLFGFLTAADYFNSKW